jgi:DNA polymerase-3 subunit epsilon
MELNLKNPIAFFDLETTGLDISKDRIVEIAVLKIDPAGNKESMHYFINPEMPIDPRATAVHGIKDEDVADAPTFAQIARKLADFIAGCDLAGYNCNRFDVPMLAEEFARVNVDVDLKKRKIVDVQVVFFKKEQRTLSAAYKFYLDREMQNAHTAEADTEATYEILKAQLDRYKDLQNDVAYLSEFTSQTRNVDFLGRIIYNDKDEEVFNFGKYKGQRVSDVLKKDPAYFDWMMKGDFPMYTKKVLTQIRLREFGK